MRAANDVLRFLLELAALVAIAAWGWHLELTWPLRLLLAAGMPVLSASIWGQFVAPRAPRYAGPLGRLSVEAGLFGGASLCLAGDGRPQAAAVFALLAAVNTVLVHVWGPRQHDMSGVR